MSILGFENAHVLHSPETKELRAIKGNLSHHSSIYTSYLAFDKVTDEHWYMDVFMTLVSLAFKMMSINQQEYFSFALQML